MDRLPLKVTVTIFFSPLHIVKSKKTLKYFLLGLKCLVCEANRSPPSVGKLKMHGALPPLYHVSLCEMLNLSQKNLDFLFPK